MDGKINSLFLKCSSLNVQMGTKQGNELSREPSSEWDGDAGSVFLSSRSQKEFLLPISDTQLCQLVGTRAWPKPRQPLLAQPWSCWRPEHGDPLQPLSTTAVPAQEPMHGGFPAGSVLCGGSVSLVRGRVVYITRADLLLLHRGIRPSRGSAGRHQAAYLTHYF